ncbi:unnamed protein product, partial [Meganyctiphanes norvegica]
MLKKPKCEWEGEYFATNGIRPDKEALGSAPDDIKAAYKSYYRARKTWEKGESAQQKENNLEKENIVIDNNIIDNEEKTTSRKCEIENKSEIKNIQDESYFCKDDNVIDTEKSIDISNINPNVWGSKFNKMNNQSQNNKSFGFNSDSLYSKMAEKMRDVGTVKVRTSLKKRSSIGSTHRLNLLRKSSNSSALSRSFSSPVKSTSDCSLESFSDIPKSIEEPNQMFPDESASVECSSQENKNNLEFNLQKTTSIFDNSSIENQSKSIFESLEKEDKIMVAKNSTDCENYNPGVNKISIPFKVKKNPFTLKTQTQIVSAVSLSSKDTNLSQLFTKNKSIDRAWLARTTNNLIDEDLESGPVIPAKDWKMKIIEKEWNENENVEDMDTEDGIKLNIVTNTELSSTKATIKNKKQKLSDEPKVQKIKELNESTSNGVELNIETNTDVSSTKATSKNKKQKLIDVPNIHKNKETNRSTSNIYGDEILNTIDIDNEGDDMEENLPFTESSLNNIENSKVEVSKREKRTSSIQIVRKNLKEFDSEDDSEHHNKEINETSQQSGKGKRKRIELIGPLSDDESGDEWKPEKNEKEMVNDDEVESGEEIEDGSQEWEENTSASRGRKRKTQTLEELEDAGVIQSSWPAPKKRRTTLNPKKGRKVLKWKAEQVAHDIVAASPKANKTKGRKKKAINPELSPRVIRKKILAKRTISNISSPNKLLERNIENKARKSIKVANKNDQVNDISNQKDSLQNSVPKSTGAAGEYNEQDDIDAHGIKAHSSNTKIVTKEDRFAKKVSTGNVNQNFVKINLKKKTFVRGKKTMTGEKYRRAEWKKKQLYKSAEQGNATAVKTLTCYKCGDFGHWAKFCPGRSEKLMGIEQYDENESTFLSLEDAANMALGIKPATTTTNVYGSENSHSWFGGSKDSEKTNQEPIPSDQVVESKDLDVGSDKNNENKELLNSEDDELFNDENMEIENTSCIVDDEEIPDDVLQAMEDDETIPDDVLQAMEDDENAEKRISTQVASVPSLNITSSQSYYNPRPSVEPLYPLKENGEVGPCTDEVKETLQMFGYSSFREGQETAIMRVLSGLSTLLILSTGSGKSLCYQLPAYLYAKYNNCITLCVSPLVSLMEDQVTGLPHFLQAVCLHHNQSTTARSKALTALQSGNAHILLVSPEAVVASRSGGVLGTLLKELPAIAFACLDEAHCVSEWSHNFRPSYLRVCHVLREKLGVKAILGLTATARHTTAISIARHLQVSDQEEGGVIRGTGVRENLLVSISRDEVREQALLELLQSDRFTNCSSIIIYCTRRNLCDRIATLIRSQLLEPSKVDIKSNMKRTRGVSFDAEAYHAGLSGSRRSTIQKRFMSGKLRMVVATVAFGMGIDKPDLRGVIHFNMPKNIESYVQEIGRAGRDGKDAHCHLFLDSQDGQDLQELKRHIYANSIDRHAVRKLLNNIFIPCACAKIRNLETSQEKDASTPTKDNSNICNESGVSNKNIDNETDEETPSKDKELDRKSTEECIASAPGIGKSSIAPSSCPRHEVAIRIEKLIEELDIPEENLQTLLCYMELQPGGLIQLKHHVYSTATVQCYGGPRQLCEISRRCPPLAVALALQRQEGRNHEKTNTAIFPVIEVSAKMGWNSGTVKRELKNMEWNNGKRPGIATNFEDPPRNSYFCRKFTIVESDK